MNQKKLQQKIRQIFLTDNIDGKKADDIAFHLTDWLDDYEDFQRLFSNDEEISSEEAKKIITNFLIHAPEHIVAAKKLYLDENVDDTFNLGIHD